MEQHMSEMKVLAMYLPQFHRVKENDEWWGEGFTEWTAVKTAEKYFDGQVQPRIPLNHNYYDLMDKETMCWQSDLMKEYGVYGMVFYHYWFKDGRIILEKPAENLLKWKDIDMPFCFSWANETWARSWSNLSDKNAWSTRIDRELDVNNQDSILIEQQYGNEEEWKKHFEYLKPFFYDKRYIRKDGKPLFIIYKPMSIPCLAKMIMYWRDLAKQESFGDIYVIGVNSNGGGCVDAILRQEPQNMLGRNRDHTIVNSQELWDAILDEDIPYEDTTFFCGFPGYDDTPRRGEGGRALSIMPPKMFEDNLTKLFQKGKERGNEYTFINAWNEWGEGMYLEPDELNGHGMLDAVRSALQRVENETNHNRNAERKVISDKYKIQGILDRYQSYWRLFDRWMLAIEQGYTVEQFFAKHKYSHIAIYGLGMLGRHLVTQLEGTSVIIDYGIDQRGKDEHQNFLVIKPDDEFMHTQVIVVTPTYDLACIYKFLDKKTNIPIISIADILEEILEG